MLYKLIIIDDDDYVIEGLKKFIDWRGIGVEIVDTASNGEEGISKIRQLRPDIVLTDISMPIMDGIEMTRIIHQEGIEARVVILTGYSEFDYAREAIKYGVSEYILKPSMPDEICNIIKRVVDICEEEKKKVEDEKLLRERLIQSMPVLTEKFIEELFEGSIGSEQEIMGKAEILGLDFNNKSYRVLAFHIDSYNDFTKGYKEGDRQFIKFSLLGIICKLLDVKNTYLNFKGSNSHVLLITQKEADEKDEDEWITDRLVGLIEKCKLQYGTSISIGIGEQVYEVLRIHESYCQCLESLKYKMYFGNGKVIFYKDIKQTEYTVPVLQLYERDKLIDGLKMRNPSMVQQCLDDMFTNIRNIRHIHFDYLKTALFEMMGTVSLILYQIGEKMPDIFSAGRNSYLEDMESKETIDELYVWLTDFFQKIFKTIGQKGNYKNMRVVNQILEYIKENYDKDISLNELSKQIYLTPNYLSTILSQSTGENFMEYLTKYRIEKAKLLLNQGKHKVYEVGDMVGYKNPDYFRRVFKEYVGVSPSEYVK
jgi:Response regulator containing CheY-like receiver domain and AraC-type DNA-binding domain